jgi:glycosyltransferase involved in cell wall biosynthesis
MEIMRVLYISFDGMTDPLGQSQVIPYLKELSSHGYLITILSLEKEQNFKARKEKITELLSSAKINWIPINYLQGVPVLSQRLNLANMRKQALKLHQETPFNIIHCRSYMSALIGEEIKKKSNVKLLFDMRGFWADERLDGKIWSKKNPLQHLIYRYFKKKEKDFLVHSDHIISLTENAKREMLSWGIPKLTEEKITVIPCCADLSHFNYEEISLEMKTSLIKKLQLEQDNFILSYLGSLGTWYMLSEMLDFFNTLLKYKPNAIFIIITADDAKVVYKLADEKSICRNALRVFSSEREDVPAYLSLSDTALFFIKPAYSKKASSPTKLGEIMGVGIPIIANSGVGDMDFILGNEPFGELIKTFDETEYLRVVENINLLTANPPEVIRNKAFAFSLQEGVNRYLEIYKKLEGI